MIDLDKLKAELLRHKTAQRRWTVIQHCRMMLFASGCSLRQIAYLTPLAKGPASRETVRRSLSVYGDAYTRLAAHRLGQSGPQVTDSRAALLARAYAENISRLIDYDPTDPAAIALLLSITDRMQEDD